MLVFTYLQRQNLTSYVYPHANIQLRHILVRRNTMSIVKRKRSNLVRSIVVYMCLMIRILAIVAPSMCYVQESCAFGSFKCAIMYILTVLVNSVCPPYIVLIQVLTNVKAFFPPSKLNEWIDGMNDIHFNVTVWGRWVLNWPPSASPFLLWYETCI